VCVRAYVCVFICLCARKHSDKRGLSGGEYNIGWDCDCDYDVADDQYVDNYQVKGVHHVGGVHHFDQGLLALRRWNQRQLKLNGFL